MYNAVHPTIDDRYSCIYVWLVFLRLDNRKQKESNKLNRCTGTDIHIFDVGRTGFYVGISGRTRLGYAVMRIFGIDSGTK